MKNLCKKIFHPGATELIKDYTCIIGVTTSLYNLFMDISHSFLRDRGII
jgi:hypothetical protein